MLYSCIRGLSSFVPAFYIYFIVPLFTSPLVPVHYATARLVGRYTSSQVSLAPCTASPLYFWITGLPCPPRFHLSPPLVTTTLVSLLSIFAPSFSTRSKRQIFDSRRSSPPLVPVTPHYRRCQLSNTETYVKLSWTRTSGDR